MVVTLRQLAGSLLEAGRDAALLLLAPQVCRQCGALVARQSDGVACRDCWEAWLSEQQRCRLACYRCGRWADGETAAIQLQSSCPQCASWSLTWVRSGGAYTGALRAALLVLKRVPHLPTPLLQLLQTTWEEHPVLHPSELLVPIPLAPRREQARGYNQAVLLAQVVAQVAGRPVVTEALARVIETHPHRAGLDERARRQALDEAFQVIRPRLIANRRILLVDDVLTSGATLDTATRTLLAAGAREVSALTAARTLRRTP
ncbi:MAG: phosphoribosyltransferase family protein [Acidobacteriota bacterium]